MSQRKKKKKIIIIQVTLVELYKKSISLYLGPKKTKKKKKKMLCILHFFIVFGPNFSFSVNWRLKAQLLPHFLSIQTTLIRSKNTTLPDTE